ncbi:MAG: hypothetical protein R3B13_15110 [Polyangiaceae bacterium]
MRATVVVLVGLALSVGACASPDELDKTGSLGGPCYPNGTCDSAYTCSFGVCGFADAGVDAAATGGSTGSGGSGGSAGTSSGGTSSGGASSGGASSGGASSGGTSSGGTSSGGTSSGGASSGGTSSGGTSSGGTSSGGTSSGGTGGSAGTPTPPTGVQGCSNCDCCDPWDVTWTATSGATYYQVAWKCSIFPVHAINVGNVTSVDLCSSTIGMCSTAECANGGIVISVQACNASGCSAQSFVSGIGVPLACGGGCCC